jgi:hypothetical protein
LRSSSERSKAEIEVGYTPATSGRDFATEALRARFIAPARWTVDVSPNGRSWIVTGRFNDWKDMDFIANPRESRNHDGELNSNFNPGEVSMVADGVIGHPR